MKLLLNEEKRSLNEIYEFYVEPREEKKFYYVYLNKKYEEANTAIINELKQILLPLKEKQDKDSADIDNSVDEND